MEKAPRRRGLFLRSGFARAVAMAMACTCRCTYRGERLLAGSSTVNEAESGRWWFCQLVAVPLSQSIRVAVRSTWPWRLTAADDALIGLPVDKHERRVVKVA